MNGSYYKRYETCWTNKIMVRDRERRYTTKLPNEEDFLKINSFYQNPWKSNVLTIKRFYFLCAVHNCSFLIYNLWIIYFFVKISVCARKQINKGKWHARIEKKKSFSMVTFWEFEINYKCTVGEQTFHRISENIIYVQFFHGD